MNVFFMHSWPPLLQLPHLATTYAAVNTLVTIGSERALSSINR